MDLNTYIQIIAYATVTWLWLLMMLAISIGAFGTMIKDYRHKNPKIVRPQVIYDRRPIIRHDKFNDYNEDDSEKSE